MDFGLLWATVCKEGVKSGRDNHVADSHKAIWIFLHLSFFLFPDNLNKEMNNRRTSSVYKDFNRPEASLIVFGNLNMRIFIVMNAAMESP